MGNEEYEEFMNANRKRIEKLEEVIIAFLDLYDMNTIGLHETITAIKRQLSGGTDSTVDGIGAQQGGDELNVLDNSSNSGTANIDEQSEFDIERMMRENKESVEAIKKIYAEQSEGTEDAEDNEVLPLVNLNCKYCGETIERVNKVLELHLRELISHPECYNKEMNKSKPSPPHDCDNCIVSEGTYTCDCGKTFHITKANLSEIEKEQRREFVELIKEFFKKRCEAVKDYPEPEQVESGLMDMHYLESELLEAFRKKYSEESK
jgi:hypothetical protein